MSDTNSNTSLIDRIGGVEAASGVLIPAVELLCQKMLKDPLISHFFSAVDLARLQSKQVRTNSALAMVFTSNVSANIFQKNNTCQKHQRPASINKLSLLLFIQVEFLAYVFGGPTRYTGKDIFEAHEHLIRHAGLNEKHFDCVVGHFRDTLTELGAAADLVDDAVKILLTARPVFEWGAREPPSSSQSVSQTSSHGAMVTPFSSGPAAANGAQTQSGISDVASPVPMDEDRSVRSGTAGLGRSGSVDDVTAVMMHLQRMKSAQDAELSQARERLNRMLSGKSGESLEKTKAALRLRGIGLVELLDDVLDASGNTVRVNSA